MSSYFKPLRRKLGVVVLLMACGIAAAWIRSLRTSDQFTWAHDKRMLIVHSGSGRIECEFRQCVGDTLAVMFWDRRFWRSFEIVTPDPSPPIEPGISEIDHSHQQKHQFFGFVIASGSMFFMIESGAEERHSEVRSKSYSSPYYNIVSPLALVSAYLLLGKPKSQSADAAQKKAT